MSSSYAFQKEHAEIYSIGSLFRPYSVSEYIQPPLSGFCHPLKKTENLYVQNLPFVDKRLIH